MVFTFKYIKIALGCDLTIYNPTPSIMRRG